MPTITINLEQFFDLLGRKMTIKELEELCFDYGLELEEDGDSTETMKVELPANRYDLLSVEGLAIAFRTFLDGFQVKHSILDPASLPNGTLHVACNLQPANMRISQSGNRWRVCAHFVWVGLSEI